MAAIEPHLTSDATPARSTFGAGAKRVGLWVLLLLVLTPFFWTDHFNGDEFHFLTQAKLIAQGAVPTRDFFEFVMPGSLLLTGLLFKLVGPSLLAARVLQAALVAALAIAYLHLGRALGFGRVLAWLPPAVLLGVFYSWHPWFSHHWFGQVGVGAALLMLWWALGSRSPMAWLWVGLAVGVTYTMQQMTGAALLAGLGLGALWVAWHQRWEWGPTLRRAGLYLLGASLPLLALAGYFLLHGTLGEAVWMTHIWSLTNYRSAGNHNDVAYLTDLSQMLSPRRLWFNLAYWYAGLGVYGFTGLLAPLTALGGFAWLAGRGRDAGDRPAATAFLGVLVWVVAFQFLAATRGRADLTHVMYVAPAATLLLAAAIAAWQRLAAGLGSLRWVPAVLAFGVVGAHGVMSATEIGRSPGSVLSGETPDQRILAREAFRTLAPQLGPKDTILAVNGAAEATIFYFYLAPNATRYTSWALPGDGYTTPAQFAEIRRVVDAERPRLLLYPELRREVADRFVQRYFPAYRLIQVVSFPEEIPWVPRRRLYVYGVASHQGEDRSVVDTHAR